MPNFDVKDMSLAALGKKRVDWAGREMKTLSLIKERFEKEKPFKGIRIAACLHITTETANLGLVLKAGGADLTLCASNPLSTQDETAAALVEHGINTFAIHGENNESYYRHIAAALDAKPQLTVDDGADLVATLHSQRTELLNGILGGTEETTTGVIRLRALADSGKLRYPIIAVNDAKTKYMFDNRYGTGQSTLDGITRATNFLWASKTVVVVGYGWCGHGVAMRAKGMGAHIIVTEVDPVKALEAVMDGFSVMPMAEAAKLGDIFITVTGDKHVIDKDHFKVMKDGATLANSGHFNSEINIPALESLSCGKDTIRPSVEEYKMKDGRRIYLLGEGRLINLAAAEGHPAAVMDMSFANQALSLEYLVKNHTKLEKKVYAVPEEIDRAVAATKLASLNISIDTLSAEQIKYLSSWQEGT